jgi:hypothetical protein
MLAHDALRSSVETGREPVRESLAGDGVVARNSRDGRLKFSGAPEGPNAMLLRHPSCDLRDTHWDHWPVSLNCRTTLWGFPTKSPRIPTFPFPPSCILSSAPPLTSCMLPSRGSSAAALSSVAELRPPQLPPHPRLGRSVGPLPRQWGSSVAALSSVPEQPTSWASSWASS